MLTVDGPVMPGVTRGRRQTAEFLDALLNLAARGLRTHCSDPLTHHLWLSEHLAERRTAVELCAGCPVLEPCGAAAEARREKFGVWGALDRTPSKAKTRRT